MFPPSPAPDPFLTRLAAAARARALAAAPGSRRATFDRDLAAHVAELSEWFTRDRDGLAAGYLSQPPVRGAYLAYFTVTTAASVQAAWRLAGMAAPAVGLDRPLRVLDLGAGTLGASLGVAALAPTAAAVEVTAIDGSRKAIDDGAALVAALRPGTVVHARTGNLREGRFVRDAVRGSFDVIVAANLFDEWHQGGRKASDPGGWLAQLIGDHLDPNGVALCVEPATRRASHTLIGIRDQLCALGGWRPFAPCCGALACPLGGSTRDWCFAEQPWTRPAEIAAIDRAIGHARAVLKFSWLAIAADRPPVAARRVIGGPMEAAGVLRRYLCADDGRLVARAELARAPAWLRDARRGEAVVDAVALHASASAERGELVVDVGAGPVRAGGPPRRPR